MNKYDELKIDIEKLIQEQNKDVSYNPQSKSEGNLILNFIKLFFQGLLVKTGIRQKLIFSNLYTGWFQKFRNYWIEELGGRPIDIYDFHFLRGSYRQKFQEVKVKEENRGDNFLEAWQDWRNIYNVFSNVFKNAVQPLRVYPFLKYIKKDYLICEYGCGIAPITQGLINYYSHKNLKIHCADIPGFLFHYARWNLRRYDFIKFIKINPDDMVPLKDNYDVIFLLNVLEHLPEPLEIIKHIYERLKPEGILAFDYKKSEGKGLDTKKSLERRSEVLKFIQDNFQVLKGEIHLDGKDISSTIVRKIRN